MRTREYGQFCGLARAAEILGQRWTILIVRDLLVRPRRYSDLHAELPGIPTNMLANRLKQLEQDGLVAREAQTGTDRSVLYRTTARAEELQPALDALGRWGAAGMREPREDEVVTDASLATALRVAAQGRTPPHRHPVTYEVNIGQAIAHATVAHGEISIAPGPGHAPNLAITAGPGFRDILAGLLDPDAALTTGAVELAGDESLFTDFAATFTVPYSPTLTP